MTRGRRKGVTRYGWWIGLFVAPLLINGMVWKALVVPARNQLEAWQETATVRKLTPKFEALLVESRKILADWARSAFTSDDPSAVMQAIQRLAGVHHVRIKELSATGQPTGRSDQAASIGTLPLELEVTGRFSQLAHWMNGVEGQSGLQIDSWTLAPGQMAGQAHRLTIKMTAFLRTSAPNG